MLDDMSQSQCSAGTFSRASDIRPNESSPNGRFGRGKRPRFAMTLGGKGPRVGRCRGIRSLRPKCAGDRAIQPVCSGNAYAEVSRASHKPCRGFFYTYSRVSRVRLPILPRCKGVFRPPGEPGRKPAVQIIKGALRSLNAHTPPVAFSSGQSKGTAPPSVDGECTLPTTTPFHQRKHAQPGMALQDAHLNHPIFIGRPAIWIHQPANLEERARGPAWAGRSELCLSWTRDVPWFMPVWGPSVFNRAGVIQKQVGSV